MYIYILEYYGYKFKEGYIDHVIFDNRTDEACKHCNISYNLYEKKKLKLYLSGIKLKLLTMIVNFQPYPLVLL